MKTFIQNCLVSLVTLGVFCSCSETNIVFIITDDQDLTLGGLIELEGDKEWCGMGVSCDFKQAQTCFYLLDHVLSLSSLTAVSSDDAFPGLRSGVDKIPLSCTPLIKMQELIANAGITFTNAFVTTPICCPSRASFLSGQYQHNHRTFNNSLNGGCSGTHWQQHVEPQTWPALLHDAGYLTFYAGKYLNQYGEKKAGGTEHVPRGWDWWIGLVGNSRYYNYTLSVNGTSEFHEADYLTDVIKEYGLKFLQQRSVLNNKFLMVLAPPAPHAPFTPAPQYEDHYKNVTAMRTPNFNVPVHGEKHWLLQMSPSPLPDSLLPELDRVYRHRWETLLSVDDMVEAIIMQLNSSGLLENTHVILTSDHGYHVGQFGLPWDKRQPYETDIRIPLLIRGPGVSAKKLISQPVLNIDFGPTFLNMAGLEVPSWMDGISFLPMLEDIENYEKNQNRTFLVEYHGEGDNATISSDCPFHGDNTLSECSSDEMCKCQDSKNNTYFCVRLLNLSENILFCKFKDSLNFMEVYDLNADPYQLHNVASLLSSADNRSYTASLDQLKECIGPSCHLSCVI